MFSYGIWSAIFLRLLLILFGTWLVSEFHWTLYLMGAFLLLTGIRMIVIGGKDENFADRKMIKWMKRWFRITPELHGNQFFVSINGLLYVTPLLIGLIFIEISDLIFAFDSIPAIFAITTDPFIVWSSNIFAILGLRALYFLLAGMIMRFHLLKYGIALILIFVGSKMLLAPWFHLSTLTSLSIIVGILLLFISLSLSAERK